MLLHLCSIMGDVIRSLGFTRRIQVCIIVICFCSLGGNTLGQHCNIIDVYPAGYIEDTNGDDMQSAGDVVHYVYPVVNNSASVISNISVSDDLVEVKQAMLGKLPAGSTDKNSLWGKYTLTQQDVDKGRVINTAYVTAELNGRKLTCSDQGTVTILQVGKLKLKEHSKFVDSNSNNLADEEEVVTYGYKIKNTGNITLKNIRVKDKNATVTGNIKSLPVNTEDGTSFLGTHRLKAEDLKAKKVVTEASIQAQTPLDKQIELTNDAFVTKIIPGNAISVKGNESSRSEKISSEDRQKKLADDADYEVWPDKGIHRVISKDGVPITKIEVFDTEGKLVHSADFKDRKHVDIDSRAYALGVYTVRINDEYVIKFSVVR